MQQESQFSKYDVKSKKKKTNWTTNKQGDGRLYKASQVAGKVTKGAIRAGAWLAQKPWTLS